MTETARKSEPVSPRFALVADEDLCSDTELTGRNTRRWFRIRSYHMSIKRYMEGFICVGSSLSLTDTMSAQPSPRTRVQGSVGCPVPPDNGARHSICAILQLF